MINLNAYLDHKNAAIRKSTHLYLDLLALCSTDSTLFSQYSDSDLIKTHGLYLLFLSQSTIRLSQHKQRIHISKLKGVPDYESAINLVRYPDSEIDLINSKVKIDSLKPNHLKELCLAKKTLCDFLKSRFESCQGYMLETILQTLPGIFSQNYFYQQLKTIKKINSQSIGNNLQTNIYYFTRKSAPVIYSHAIQQCLFMSYHPYDVYTKQTCLFVPYIKGLIHQESWMYNLRQKIYSHYYYSKKLLSYGIKKKPQLNGLIYYYYYIPEGQYPWPYHDVVKLLNSDIITALSKTSKAKVFVQTRKSFDYWNNVYLKQFNVISSHRWHYECSRSSIAVIPSFSNAIIESIMMGRTTIILRLSVAHWELNEFGNKVYQQLLDKITVYSISELIDLLNNKNKLKHFSIICRELKGAWFRQFAISLTNKTIL